MPGAAPLSNSWPAQSSPVRFPIPVVPPGLENSSAYRWPATTLAGVANTTVTSLCPAGTFASWTVTVARMPSTGAAGSVDVEDVDDPVAGGAFLEERQLGAGQRTAVLDGEGLGKPVSPGVGLAGLARPGATRVGHLRGHCEGPTLKPKQASGRDKPGQAQLRSPQPVRSHRSLSSVGAGRVLTTRESLIYSHAGRSRPLDCYAASASAAAASASGTSPSWRSPSRGRRRETTLVMPSPPMLTP